MNYNDKIDTSAESIMTEIRQEINISNNNYSKFSSQSNFHSNETSFDWSQIRAHLNIAEQNADVGTKIFPMLRFPRYLRFIARLINRIINFFAQVITYQQRNYNDSILQSFKTNLNVIQEMERKYQISILDIKNKLSIQEHRLKMLIDNLVNQSTETLKNEQINLLSNEMKHIIDTKYIEFENRFRGTNQEIKEKLKVYLPIIKSAKMEDKNNLILDIGCGRGEWLELLKNEGLESQGVDSNKAMVNECQSLSLNVIESDMFDFLKSCPDSSIAAVTAFHLVEHLDYKLIINFLGEVVRVLKTGGIAIFETPNPENILVGACNFYTDPTHRNPLPANTTKFIAESMGFYNVEILYLNHSDDKLKINDSDSEVVKRFNNYFYGPQDYAIIGYKN